MTTDGIFGIRVSKGDFRLHVHGDRQGMEGVNLASGGVDRIYDAPVSTTWKTAAFMDGSKPKAYKKLHRDMNLKFQIKGSPGRKYEVNDSLFRQLFDYADDEWDDDEEPTRLEVDTQLSGTRYIDVLMYEDPDFQPVTDSLKQQFGVIIMKLRAGQPMWYEDDVITHFQSGGTSGEGWIEVENPTDQVMRHEWALTRARWVLPDFQWKGKKGLRAPGGLNSGRVITVPEIANAQGGAKVSLDRSKLMLSDANDTNFLPLLNGQFFNYAIPPYTPKTLLPVAYTNAPAGGARCELRQPRRWSRPWGLELQLT